ncbi:MAG: integration host factor subunit alpha [Magnetococcales bacterium]|nr:integration host factor subunit alpha [Magnetococcales bacterium]
MATTTKADLVAAVHEHSELSKPLAITLVEQVFEHISQHLGSGETVKLSGFGVFSVRSKRVRPGRNPKTGEPIEITARKVVTFRDSPLVLKDNGEQTSFGMGSPTHDQI